MVPLDYILLYLTVYDFCVDMPDDGLNNFSLFGG